MKSILTSIALCVLGCQLPAQVSFVLSSTLSPGTYPQGVTAADVNGDGKVDLISANSNDNTLSVLTNNGNGGFVLAHTYPVGANPYLVTTADVNGDGKLDIISVNENSNALSVLTNNGSGGFVLSSSPIVGNHPWGLTAADVNGDGKVDLICANGSDNTLSVLTNNGSGGFALASSPGVGNNPVSVVAADVNGDGKLDLISANYSGNTLSVLTNNGSGGFVLAGTYAVGNSPRTVVAADVNGDGKPDLISANFNDSTLSILTNNGSGGFVLAASPTVGSNPFGLTSADVNGDGKVDLISANFNNTLSVLTNDGSGNFVLAASPSVGGGAQCVVAADVNGDGKVDLISANAYSSSLSVLTNATPFSTPTTPTTPPVITSFTPQSGAIGTAVTITGTNFSATASADIVYFGAVQANVLLASPTSLQVTVPAGATYAPITVTVNGLTAYASQPFMPTFPGIGQVSFTLSSSPGVGSAPQSVVAADINGDGKPDLISANRSGNNLTLLTNNGSGNYVLASSPAVGNGPASAAAADVNGDGKLDLISADQSGNTLTVLTNTGNGGFVTAGTYVVGNSPVSVVAADVNGDGKVDLIAANYLNNTLSVLTNNGNGGFVLASSPTVGSNPAWVTAADVNGDGKPDLICANYGGNTLSVLTNNGNGGFALASSPGVGNGPQSVTAADVNGDGKLDLICANRGDNSLSVLTNNGNGSFTLAGTYAVGNSPVSVTAANIKGYGMVDLICANLGNNTVSVLTNNGTGGFVLATSPSVGNGPYSVVVADVNGDGRADLICANAYGNTFSVMTNDTPFPQTTPPCDPAPSGLVSWWPGEGNANDIVGANNGTPTGGITYINGEVGQAFVLNGSTSYIPVPASSSLDIGATGSGITIEGWIKPNQLGPVGAAGLPIVEWDSASTDGLQLWVQGAWLLYANVEDTGHNPHVIQSAPNLISTNSFQHVALTYDKGSGAAMLYINGTMVASNNFGNITPQTTYGMNIGRRTGQPIGNGDTFNGLIDELSLYNRALSSAEIAAIYNAGSSGKCPPTLTLPAITSQPMNQTVTVGNTATFSIAASSTSPLNYQWSCSNTNIVGATNATLTLNNVQFTQAGNYSVQVANSAGSTNSIAVTLTVNPLPPCDSAPSGMVSWWPGEGNANDIVGANNGTPTGDITYTNGEVGQAFVLNGSTSYIPVPASPSLDIGATGSGITIEGWIKPNQLGPVGAAGLPIVEWDSASTDGLQLWVEAGFTLFANIKDTGNNPHVIQSAPNLISTNTFQHVALTYDKNSGAAMIYINGVMVVSNNFGSITPQTTYGMNIGRRTGQPIGNGDTFNGLIDELSLYNRALTATEIQAIYSADSSGKCPPTLTSSVVPVISSFTPATGTDGIVITIAGTNFSATASTDIVYFGAVQANVLSASPTSLQVTVPVGATFAPISVTVNGLTAYADQPFMPTFSGLGQIDNTSLAPMVNLPTGAGPIQTVIADMDGDGKPDMIIADTYAGEISIYRNISTNGSLTAGSFAPRVDIALLPSSGTSPYMIGVADLDGDGRLDIIALNADSNVVSILRNISTPGNLTTNSFAARMDLPAGTNMRGLAVQDLNGDGKPEIVTANQNSPGTVSVFQNMSTIGNIAFAPRVDFAAGNGPSGVAIGDLDGDGYPDLAVANYYSGTISVFRNLGTGGNITTSFFAPKVDFPTLASVFPIAIGDMDGDGKLDLVVGCGNGSQVISVYRNTATPGSITTGSFAAHVDFAAPGWVNSVALADLDGDGKLDVAVASQLSSVFSIFKNVSVPGSFTTASLAARVDYPAGYNPDGVAIGDLDGDGRPDVVFANAYDSTISIYRNIVTFAASVTAPVPVITSFTPQSGAIGTAVTITGTNFSATASANIVYFGAVQANVLFASATSLQVTVPMGATYAPITVTVNGLTAYASQPFMPTFPGSGQFSFTLSSTLDVDVNPESVVAADVNGDGKVDLICAHTSGNTLSVLTNDGSGNFVLSSSPVVGNSPWGVVAADVNGDGKLDLICANRSGNTLSVLTNNGSGGFVLSSSPVVGSGPFGVAAADVNGDGMVDLICANKDANTLSVLTNNGHGSFATAGTYVVGSEPSTVVAADINGDGMPDLICANSSGNTLSVLTNNGSGGFVLSSSPVVDNNPYGLVAADVNGDGKVDLISSGGSMLMVLTNNGFGGFTLASSLPVVGSSHFGDVASDVNGDGKVDLIYVNGSTLLVFTNNGGGVFGLAATPIEGSSPYTIAAADVNGDGKPDLICANYFNSTLSILTNTTLLPPVADATATVPLVISVNNSNATVVLNGSLSSDPNGKPLQYTWYQTGSLNPLATGVIAVVVLPVGTNSITLMVSDGPASSQQTISVAVITLAQAVDQLEAVVNDADISQKQSLIASLNAALGAIDRSNPTAAINQLQAFQNKVTAQISPLDPELAQTLIDSAQSIINALSAGGAASHKALKAAAQANGKLHLNFSGIHQQVYIIEASTNLVDWQMIGVANDLGDGTFDFDDTDASHIPQRYYRVVAP